MGHEQVWNVPYRRNPVFTGREPLLAKLVEALHSDDAAALTQPQALSGLGGIGKTQIALEYAYRYRQEYEVVLWAQADTHENLTSSYLTFAALLQLLEKDEQESAIVIAAVKNWLQRATNWLLILDNADELTLLPDFLPPRMGGKVILTTRAQAPGRFAHRVEVDTLSPEIGALFLLRRAGRLANDAPLEHASEDEQDGACAICELLGGLPLALDQAGAYIEETRCSLSDYLHLYQEHRKELLLQRSTLSSDYSESVATTWKLSFEQVEQTHPAAADLLRFCAFLAPDAIPEDLLHNGASELGPVLGPVATNLFHLNTAIRALMTYSLIHRNADDHVLRVHRLVQEVQRDDMDVPMQQRWAERVVRAVNAIFPSERWLSIQALLPHALASARLIADYQFFFYEASQLLNQTASYLNDIARYQEAEPLYQRALAIREKVLGPEHIETGIILNNLAALYYAQGRYQEAEPLYQRALAIYEKTPGVESTMISSIYNNLAYLHQAQGRYREAEPLYQRALAIREKALGLEHPETSATLDNLGQFHQAQGHYQEAEPLYQRALAIREKVLGPEHAKTGITLNNLGQLHQAQGRYREAEPLYRRALDIYEKAFGVEHPEVSITLNNLAGLYQAQGRSQEAEPLYVQALKITEQRLGAEHPVTATCLNNLALLYESQGKYEEAEPLYVRALAIYEQQLGPQHPSTQTVRTNYAFLLQTMGRKGEAR